MINAKLIYLLAEPLTSRDYVRFGVEKLHKIFNEVEIWELHAILGTSKDILSPDYPNKIFQIKSLEELRNKLSALTSVDEVICIGIFSNMHTFRQLRVGSLVSKSDSQFSVVSFASLPHTVSSDSKNENITTFEKFARKLSKPRIEGFLVRKILSFSHSLNQKNPKILRFRTIHRIWYSTNFSEIPSVFISNDTFKRAIHHFDYDLIISETENKSIIGGPIVLIDSMGPVHPDYCSGLYLDVPDFEAWKSEVLKALKLIEAHVNCEIQIAAHPRSSEKISTETYGGRTSFLGRTCSMVRNSPLVVILEGSTAVNFAVVFRRPILFVDSPIFEPRLRSLNHELSGQLGMPILRLDTPTFDFSIPEVDENLYREYQERYIKLPGTSHKYFWSTVTQDYLNYFGGLGFN